MKFGGKKMEIKILGMGCAKCKKMEENVRQAVKELNINAKIEKVENIDKITDMGVMMTPGLVIDGNVVSQGKVLAVSQIKQLLSKK